MRDAGTCRLQPDLGHRLAELVAILGDVDGMFAGADQLDAVLLEHAVAGQIQRTVQRGLATHRRQQRIRALLVDDLLDRLPADRLDVGRVGHLRVGHDRRGVGVDEHDFVAQLAQGFAGLGAGIVELAGLSDNDGA